MNHGILYWKQTKFSCAWEADKVIPGLVSLRIPFKEFDGLADDHYKRNRTGYMMEAINTRLKRLNLPISLERRLDIEEVNSGELLYRQYFDSYASFYASLVVYCEYFEKNPSKVSVL